MAWIRSQDKQSICNVSGILIDDLVLINYPAGLAIGKFASLEAALAELDAIYRWIESGAPGVYQVGGDADA